MRPIICATALLLGAIPIFAAEEGDFFCYPGGLYESRISEEAIKKCPAWVQSAENPPLSVRKALKLADAMKQKLVHDSTKYRWRREWIGLDNLAHEKDSEDRGSFWHVNYKAWPVGSDKEIRSVIDTRECQSLNIFVLMDGTVVKPVVKKATATEPENAGPRPSDAPKAKEFVYPTYGCYMGSQKSYVSRITAERLKKCPAWLDRAEDPPISVRKALKLADAKKRKFRDKSAQGNDWKLEWITLEAFGNDVGLSKGSYWHIRYVEDCSCGGMPDGLDLFVLMDGTAVEPVVDNDDLNVDDNRSEHARGPE